MLYSGKLCWCFFYSVSSLCSLVCSFLWQAFKQTGHSHIISHSAQCRSTSNSHFKYCNSWMFVIFWWIHLHNTTLTFFLQLLSANDGSLKHVELHFEKSILESMFSLSLWSHVQKVSASNAPLKIEEKRGQTSWVKSLIIVATCSFMDGFHICQSPVSPIAMLACDISDIQRCDTF